MTGFLTEKRRVGLGFWILGLVNNFGYVVVLSAAQSLANSFGKGNLIGVLNWADVGLGLVARLTNVALEGVAYSNRVLGACVIAAIGYVGLAVSTHLGFWWAVVAITAIGAFSSYGENVQLTHLRNYDPNFTGYWASGTGAAGIFGALFYLGLSSLNVSNDIVFWLMTASVPLYFLASRYLVGTHVPVAYQQAPTTDKEALLADPLPISRVASVGRPAETLWQRTLRCMRLALWVSSNLALVYFFEYVVSVGAAAKANGPDTASASSWFIRQAYPILAFCYQFGVIISRSSLSFVRVKRVGVITALQAINFVLWLVNAKYLFLPFGAQVPLMIYVGLLGGASYVNVFASLIDDPNIPEDDREFCINVGAVFINFGIVAASVFEIIMDATFLS